MACNQKFGTDFMASNSFEHSSFKIFMLHMLPSWKIEAGDIFDWKSLNFQS